MNKLKTLIASKNPLADIALVTYEGQNPMHRQYKGGYEDYFNAIPVLDPSDPILPIRADMAKEVITSLGNVLVVEDWIQQDDTGGDNGFSRSILAIQSPDTVCTDEFGTAGKMVVKEGPELIVAKWGVGKTSPIHGHKPGLLHEQILTGRMRVNTYQVVNEAKRIVRPLATTIEGKGVFLSKYNMPTGLETAKDYPAFIHNFVALEYSASLHYVPGHTRDGRDNMYTCEYFEDYFSFNNEDLRQITAKDGMYSRIGDVILVRSLNVPEYGDHYIIITGAPVMKEHGLRPQDIAIQAPHAKRILDAYDVNETGVTLLKLSDEARDAFMRFHNMRVDFLNKSIVYMGASQTAELA